MQLTKVRPLGQLVLCVFLAAFIVATTAPTVRGDDAMDYAQLVDQIKQELAIPFSSPDDPKLLERRARLRVLFDKIPVSRAQTLHDRLGLNPTSDELSKAFHYKLATATRSEMLGILQGKIAAVTAAPAPTTTTKPSPSPVPPVHVWPASPLPSSESGRFDSALRKLEEKVKTSDDKRKRRYECWFNKLKAPGADDRVIEWSRICPAKTGALGAAYIVGPCDITKGTPVSQDEIHENIKSIPDVDTKGVAIGIVTHLKAAIVVSEEMTSQPLENLRATHDRVIEAIDKLDKWANNQAGGSSMMGKEYVAIKDWIGQRQRDPKSAYSCQ